MAVVCHWLAPPDVTLLRHVLLTLYEDVWQYYADIRRHLLRIESAATARNTLLHHIRHEGQLPIVI